MTIEKTTSSSPKKNSLTSRIVIGMVAGILLGTFLQWLMPNGSDKVIKLFDTQKEALAYTKTMADNQGTNIHVHASKGVNKGKIMKNK